MSNEVPSKKTLEIPPVRVRNDLARSMLQRPDTDGFWKNHAHQDLTIVGQAPDGKPEDPLLVIETPSMQGLRREILFHNVRSANGHPLPPPAVLHQELETIRVG